MDGDKNLISLRNDENHIVSDQTGICTVAKVYLEKLYFGNEGNFTLLLLI